MQDRTAEDAKLYKQAKKARLDPAVYEAKKREHLARKSKKGDESDAADSEVGASPARPDGGSGAGDRDGDDEIDPEVLAVALATIARLKKIPKSVGFCLFVDRIA